MYFFIFDSFLQDSKYQGEVAHIEARIASLGLQGRTEKITILKNAKEAAERAVERGATTVVAVGNDQTVTKILPALASHHVTLGYIPLGQPTVIAQILGVRSGAAACEDISRRIIEKIDLGRAGGQYFLSAAEVPPATPMECDGKYTVTSTDAEARTMIVNLGSDEYLGCPDDGMLEVVLSGGTNRRSRFFGSHRNRPSVFPVKQVKIPYLGPSATIRLDGTSILKTPLTIEAVPQKLTVIVGAKRKF